MQQEETTARTPITFRDAREILFQRRWLVGGALFACWLMVWSASWLLPSVYRSDTVILVEQQKVPEEYVVANVSVDLQQRLEGMRQQILSRTRLQRIIDQFQLYRDGRHSGNPEEIIEQMRKDITTELVESPGRHGQLSAFKISYSAPSARLAQQVNAQLTSLFIDQNIQEQSERSESTTEFLSAELDSARTRLAEQEGKIKQFKGQYLGQLPSQVDSNVRILSGMQERRNNLSQSLNRAQEQKLYLESLLAQYRSVKAEGENGGNSLPGIDEQLTKLKQELADDQTKYTPNHPDVLRLKRLIARTEKQKEDVQQNLAAGNNAPAASKTSQHDLQTMTPILQLEGQLKANQQEIADTRREAGRIDEQIGAYQGRLNGAPIREQQLADLTRDYEQSKSNYDSLLKKQEQSQLATNLEKRQQGEQFRIIDPPSLPNKPVSPDRLKLSMIGLVAGLLLGIGLAVVVEAIDDRVRNEEEIARIVNVRILAGIPHLSTPEELIKQRRRRILEWSCACLMLAVMVAANTFTSFRS
jgi:polysaccharide chain length determinant protein (PEP-CTERM system associated)